MKHERKEKRDLVWKIGFIASCIAILTFITGWENIGDIFKSLFIDRSFHDTPKSTQEVFPTQSELIATKVSHTNLASTPEQYPSLTPVPPIDVSSDYPLYPGASLSLVQSIDTGFRIRVHIPGSGTEAQTFLNDARFAFNKAVKDITGQWAIVDSINSWYNVQLDSNGTVFVPTSPGDYSLRFGSQGSNYTQIIGCNFPHPDNYSSTLFFPIQSQYTTEITFTPGRLEVGILSSSGEAIQNTFMDVNCQGEDISGNPIFTNPYCEISSSSALCYEGWVGTRTDARGVATFFLAPGKYSIRVVKAGSVIKEEYNVIIEPNEIKQIILAIGQ